jgi:autotransporter-associated beta strand protein
MGQLHHITCRTAVVLGILIGAVVIGADSPGQSLTGLWEFSDGNNLAAATVGTPLTVNGTAPTWFASQTYGSVTLDGVINTVVGSSNSILVTHGIGANGGGIRTNDYTFVYDVRKPTATLWRSFYQTDLSNTTDAEFFVRGSGDGALLNTVGRSDIGFSPAALAANVWYRLVVSADLGTSFTAYRDGAPFATYAVPAIDDVDYSLDPSQVLFFADQTVFPDGTSENHQLTIGSMAVYGGALTAGQAALLGTAGSAYPALGSLTWAGTPGNASWNTSATNWIASGSATAFASGDSVTFDDSATATTVDVPAPVAASRLAFANASKAYTLQGSGSIDAVAGMTKTGAGTLTLALPVRVQGGATFATGTVRVGNGGTVGSLAGDVSLGAGATLAFDRSDEVTTALSITGSGGVMKSGAGRLTLAGTSSYSGATTVTSGTLVTAGAFSGAGGITVAGSAGLVVGYASSPATLAVPSLSLGAGSGLGFALTGAGIPQDPLLAVSTVNGLTRTGTTTLSITSGQGLSTGTFTLIDYAGTAISSGFALASLPRRVAAGLVYDTANTRINLAVTSADSIIWRGNVTNIWDAGTDVGVGGTPNWVTSSTGTQTNFIDGDRVAFTDMASQFTVDVSQTLAPGLVTIDNTSQRYVFAGIGKLSGVGGLVKQGAGEAVLSTNNDYTGGTTVTAGTLQIGEGATTGSIVGSVAVGPAATLRYFRGATTTSSTIRSMFSGSGAIEFDGTGVVGHSSYILSGTSTGYSGTVTVDQARLGLGSNAAAVGGGSLVVSSGGQVWTGSSSTITPTFTNALSLSGSGWAQGTGNRLGALRLDGRATWAGDITLASNARITAWGSAGTITGRITGAYRPEFGGVGSGQVTLANDNNDYTGGTLISTGGVTAAAANAFGPGVVTITSTSQESVAFNRPSGSVTTVANAFVLPAVAAKTRVFTLLGTPTTSTTIVLAGRISGGSASSNFQMADTNVSGNHNNVLVLANGSNSFEGTITAFRGYLGFTSDAALGNVDNDLAVNVNNSAGGLRFAADGITLAASRSVDLFGQEVIDTQAFTGRIAGPIGSTTGLGGLTKRGVGTLVIAADATYPGPTVVQAGTLDVRATILGSGSVSVAAGGTLAGSGTVAGPVAFGPGSILSPGSSPGTLTMQSSVSWGEGGAYAWQMLSGTGIPGTQWDLASIGGVLDIAATSADPFRINLWTLSGTGPDISGPAAGFDATRGATWTIASAAGGITNFAADKFRVIATATQGTAGFANPFGTGTFSLAQTGNDLTLVYTAGTIPAVVTINVPSGTQTQGQAGYPTLSGSIPVLKTGAGTLVLDQANPLTASTTVQGGVLQLANGSALTASRLVIVAGGTGQVAPVTATSVASLDLASGNGLMDLTSGALTIASGLTATELVAEILEGRGDGSWTGTSGITSSTAAAEAAAGTPRAVGWIDNGDGSLTTAYAAPGDTNIDWSIDILDAANFLSGGKFDTGSPAIWFEGDFSYDGIVDILDAADFFATGLYDAGTYNTAPGLSGGVAAVPEPCMGSILLGTLTFACMSSRLRRRLLCKGITP